MHGEEHYDATKCQFVLPQDTIIEAYSVNTELCPVETDQTLINKLWPNLEDDILHDVKNNMFSGPADILIGIDNFWKLKLTNILPHNSHRFGIIRTKFGWTISGNLSEETHLMGKHIGYNRISINLSKISEIENSLKKLFNRDEEIENESRYSYEQEYAINLFERTITQRSDGQYVVNPLFKKESVKLRNNYFLAMTRFNSLRKSLKRYPERFKLYNEALQSMIDDNTVEEVIENSEITKNMSKFFYFLPHSAVIKLDRVTTKIRVVFDASAKNSEGQSLNDQLLEGPKLQLDIVELLIRMRLKKIVLLADVAKMFYSILIDEKFRDYFRFLWNSSEDDIPKVYRFRKLLMGAKSSPYLAIATVHHHLNKVAKEEPEKQQLCQLLKESLYVDDLITGVDTIEEAIELRKNVTDIFKGMNMAIRKWASNSHQLIDTIPEDDRYPFEPLCGDNNPNVTFYDNQETTGFITKDTKCLGMSWDPKHDKLHYKTYKELKEEKQPKLTKRGISATIPSLYDPCGLMMPFITEGKIILQKAWCYRNDKNESLDWDHPLPPEIREEFGKWLEKLPKVSSITHERYIFNDSKTPLLPEEFSFIFFVTPAIQHLA